MNGDPKTAPRNDVPGSSVPPAAVPHAAATGPAQPPRPARAGRPLRIAYVNASLDLGGSERQMLALAERLPKDRFQVDFLLLTHAGHLAPRAREAGAGIRVLNWHPPRDWLRPVFYPYWLLRFVPAIRSGHYDVVDAWLFHAYAAAAVTRPLSRIPVLIGGRRSLSDFKGEFNAVERVLDRLSRHRVDAIVANSEAVRRDVAAHEAVDPAQIRVIHNGVAIPAPMPPERRRELRAGWGVGDADVVVGCVANYKPHKGLEMLVEIAADLRPTVPNLRFVLVGEGPSRPLLEGMIAERGLAGVVILHGRALDARDLYGAFDAAAHASESEGLPNGVLEAAAAGRPLVVTDAGGAAEVVADGETGYVVPIGDRAAFGAALCRLAEDAELRSRLGAAGRRRAETVFGFDRFVAETAALYEELVAARRARRRSRRSIVSVPRRALRWLRGRPRGTGHE